MSSQDRAACSTVPPGLTPHRDAGRQPQARQRESPRAQAGAVHLASPQTTRLKYRYSPSQQQQQPQEQQQQQQWSSAAPLHCSQSAQSSWAQLTVVTRAASCSHLPDPLPPVSCLPSSPCRRHSEPTSLATCSRPKRLCIPYPEQPCFQACELVLPNSPCPSPSPTWSTRPIPPAWPAADSTPPYSHLRPHGSSSCHVYPTTTTSMCAHATPKRLSFPRSTKVSPSAAPPQHLSFMRRSKQVSLPGNSACHPPMEPLHAWLPSSSPPTIPRSTSDQKPPRVPSRDKPPPRRSGPRIFKRDCSKESVMDPSLLIAARQDATVVGGGAQQELLHALGLSARTSSRAMPSLTQRTPAMSDMPTVDLRMFGKRSLPDDADMHVAQRTPAMSDMPSVDLRMLGPASVSLPAELPEDMHIAQRTPAVMDMLAAAGVGAYLDLHTGSSPGCSTPACPQAAEASEQTDLANAQVCSRTEAVANLALEPSSSVTTFKSSDERVRTHERHPLLVFPTQPAARISSPGTSNRSSNTSTGSTEPQQGGAAAAADTSKAVSGCEAASAKILEDSDAGELSRPQSALAAAADGGPGLDPEAGPGGCCSGWMRLLLGRSGGQQGRRSFSRLEQPRRPRPPLHADADAACACFLCAWTTAGRPPLRTATAYACQPPISRQSSGCGRAAVAEQGGEHTQPGSCPAPLPPAAVPSAAAASTTPR